MVLPTGYHLLPKNEQYLQKLGYKGPSHHAKMHFCAKLGRGLYGLVQAARQWWKKIIKELISIRFVKREVDPCLLYKRNKEGLCIVIVNIDDCLCLGDEIALTAAVQEIKHIFKVKVTYNLDDYLGCRLLQNNPLIFIHQPHIYKHLKEKFLPIITQSTTGELKAYTTPGTPGFRVI